MLNFIGTGANPAEQHVIGVLPLSHRSELEPLTRWCCTELVAQVSTTSVTSIAKVLHTIRDSQPCANRKQGAQTEGKSAIGKLRYNVAGLRRGGHFYQTNTAY